MASRYGITDAQWQSAVAEATAILRACARSQPGTITYSDLAAQLSSISVQPHDLAMDYLLEPVSREEHAACRPLLSVIVVHKGGDMSPGSGFYDLARELGFNVSDRVAFWCSEFQRVTDYWRNHP